MIGQEAELDMKEAAKELYRANEALQDHQLQPHMDTVISKCPPEYMTMAGEWADHEAAYPTRGRSGTVIEEPDVSEKGLVQLHTKVCSAVTGAMTSYVSRLGSVPLR